jgi:hypothetical protein
MFDKQVKVSERTVMTHFKILSWYSPEMTEENHKSNEHSG